MGGATARRGGGTAGTTGMGGGALDATTGAEAITFACGIGRGRLSSGNCTTSERGGRTGCVPKILI